MDNILNARLQHAVEHTENNTQIPAPSSVPLNGEIVFNSDRTNFKVGNGNDSYSQLTDVIPAAQVNSDWNASSGVAKILNKPNLSVVATSNSYVDLYNRGWSKTQQQYTTLEYYLYNSLEYVSADKIILNNINALSPIAIDQYNSYYGIDLYANVGTQSEPRRVKEGFAYGIEYDLLFSFYYQSVQFPNTDTFLFFYDSNYGSNMDKCVFIYNINKYILATIDNKRGVKVLMRTNDNSKLYVDVKIVRVHLEIPNFGIVDNYLFL